MSTSGKDVQRIHHACRRCAELLAARPCLSSIWSSNVKCEDSRCLSLRSRPPASSGIFSGCQGLHGRARRLRGSTQPRQRHESLPGTCLLVHCRAAKAALYHGESCGSFVSAAEELQAVLLSDRLARQCPGLLLEYEIILQEALCLFARFSST